MNCLREELHDQIFSDDLIIAVAEVVEDWEKIAPLLGVNAEDVRTSVATSELHQRKCLQQWKKQAGYHATYYALLEVLLQSDLGDTACKVCELFKKASHQQANSQPASKTLAREDRPAIVTATLLSGAPPQTALSHDTAPKEASGMKDRPRWCGTMQVVLHSNYFHLIVILLIILDVVVVLFELLLDVGALGNIVCLGDNFVEQLEFCHFHEESRAVCAPSPRLILSDQYLRSEQTQVECKCGFRGGRRICVPRAEGKGVDPDLILHSISLFIVTLFVLEVVFKLAVFRLKYFTDKYEVFDGIIILVSWILDIASLLEEEAFKAASLLILLRLWRIIRVINGSVLSSLTQSNAQLVKARQETKSSIEAFHKARQKLEIVQGENSSLRQQLEQVRQRSGTFHVEDYSLST